MRLNRRRFLQGSSALLIAPFFPIGYSQAAKHRALPIPPMADGTYGEVIPLNIQEGHWFFNLDTPTKTLGFSQDFLGPTIRTRQGTKLNLSYSNNINENVSVHGHGLHVTGELDGGPHRSLAPGDSWNPSLPIIQQAATCWYHSHTHGKTGDQVYRGLAGLIIIDDDNADSLNLPSRYGIDDIPVIFQDKTFDTASQLVYSLKDAGEDGWLGETVIVNGAIAPLAKVPKGLVRLRLLNAANARFYILQFKDGRTFQQIASDGGLLPSAVPISTLEMGPGERCEIIVDMSDGLPASLLTLFEDAFDGEDGEDEDDGDETIDTSQFSASLFLEVNSTLTPHNGAIAKQLNTISRPLEKQVKVTRDFILEMQSSDNSKEGETTAVHHHTMPMTINGASMDMAVINESVKAGIWERWRIKSDAGEHPFHIHGCSFLIDKIAGEEPSKNNLGWKDTVILDDDAWSEILVKFDLEANQQYPYMYHCHILEHEDMGMMGQFTVTGE
jgi:FtsP/CotA-like multicopper oxidase with cupredoxin domain